MNQHNTEQNRMLRNAHFDGSHYALSALGVLLSTCQEHGSIVYISPSMDVVITVNKVYMNIWQWDAKNREYVAREVRSHGGYDDLRDMPLKTLETWAKDSYVWFMEAWFNIEIDPSTL